MVLVTDTTIHTPAEYRPLNAVEDSTATFARIGYVFAALRREVDWHHAVSQTSTYQAHRYAGSVCEHHVRDAIASMLDFTPVDVALATLQATLAATTMTIGEGEADIDADQLPYRADAASRIGLIARNEAATF